MHCLFILHFKKKIFFFFGCPQGLPSLLWRVGCLMWDLAPLPGIEPGPCALSVGSGSPATVPILHFQDKSLLDYAQLEAK